MKITALLHGYPPYHNAGAEWMLHEMLKFLNKKHEVEVMMPDVTPYEFEGIKVNKDNAVRKAVDTSDIVISHLKQSGRALNLCEYYKTPYVQVIHNYNYYSILKAKNRPKGQGRFAYVIYNSDFTRYDMNYPNPGIVVHPPVESKRYKTKPGDKITLINLFERKGGKFFHELAKLMPDYEFLGVEGGYGDQEKDKLKNVSYMANTPDAKKIYSKTRILLMPSLYESYGRTAVEAMCSGIPVIAAPTPGLRELLGDAGIFCKLESPLSWIEAIKELDDEKKYKEASDKCLKRSKEIEKSVDSEMKNMEKFFNDIISNKL